MKAQFVLPVIISVVLMAAISSFASGWGHVNLQSGDTSIQVDYQTPFTSGNTVAGASLYVNVTFPNKGSCQSEAIAIFTTFCGEANSGPLPSVETQIPLSLQESNDH